MLENAVARRYAQAFFAIAQEKNELDKLEEELRFVIETINSNPELKMILDHQLVAPEEKKEILSNIFSQELSEITLNFLAVIAEKYRAPYIEEIYKQFVGFANEAKNIAEAYIKSAQPLGDKDLAAIQEKLSKATCKNIKLINEVDPNLIGGVVVRIGDKVMDGSILRRLDLLKEKLMQISVKEIGVRN